MADKFTPQKRSAIMAKVRQKDTSLEILFRKKLHALGLRFQLHRLDLPGKPDLVFPRFHAVVFVHGCFWHMHKECRMGHPPSSNRDFWINKLNKNVQRDKQVIEALTRLGWQTFVVWGCELNSNIKLEESANRIAVLIRSS